MGRPLRGSASTERSILEHLPDPVFLVDDQNQFVYVCPNAARAFGRDIESIRELGSLETLLGPFDLPASALARDGEVRGLRLDVDLGEPLGLRFFVGHVQRVEIGNGTRLVVLRDATERVLQRRIIDRLFRVIYEVALAENTLGAAQRLVEEVLEITGWSAAEVWVARGADRPMTRVSATARSGDLRARQFVDRSSDFAPLPSEGLTRRAMTEGQPVWIEDIRESSIDFIRADLAREAGFESACAIPVADAIAVRGALTFFISTRTPRQHFLIDVFERMAVALVIVLQRIEEQDRLRGITAFLDGLIHGERRSIANYLLNDLGQMLAEIRIMLDETLDEVTMDHPKIAQQLSQIRSRIDSALPVLQDTALNAHPATLDEFGLEAAVEIFLEGFAESGSPALRWSLTLEDCPRDPRRELIAFQLLYDVVYGAGRYPGTDQISIQFGCERADLHLAIVCEGRDLNRDRLSARGRIGLDAAREQVRNAGGTLSISIAQNSSARVELYLPGGSASQPSAPASE